MHLIKIHLQVLILNYERRLKEMESYTYLLVLALILLSTKLLGLATEKIHMPQVVGALIAGIVLGPSGIGILENTDFLVKTAEIGVIMLMFTAGIDTDISELKDTGFKSFIIACMGVFVPLILCGGLYFLFFLRDFTTMNLLKAAFVGSVFSATSVSITVETLNEMGKLKSKTGTILLSAALIDDILGIVVLSVLTGLSSGGENPLAVLGKIGLFFVFTLGVGYIIRILFNKISERHDHSRRIAVWALAFCFLMSYVAEAVFGVADITGAFFAGLILCNLAKARQFVAKKFTVTAYMIFTPVFFASVGMKTNLTTMNKEILIFALLLNFFFKTEPGSMLLLCLIIFLLNFFMFLISAYLIKKNKEYEEKMYLIEFESLERKKRVAKIREESLSDYVQDYTPKAPDDKLSFPILFYSISFVLSIAVILLLYEAL